MYIAEDVTADGRTLPACIIRALASDSFCAPDCWGSQLMFQMWHPVPLNRRAVGRFGLPTGYWTAHLTTPIHSRCYALGCTCRVFGCIGNLLYPLHVILPHSRNYPKFLLSTNCMTLYDKVCVPTYFGSKDVHAVTTNLYRSAEGPGVSKSHWTPEVPRTATCGSEEVMPGWRLG